MNILFDPLAIIGLLVPAGGVAVVALRKRHRNLLDKGLALKSAGRYFEAERLLSNASSPVPALGLGETHPQIVEAKLQLCWLWLQVNKDEQAARALNRMVEIIPNKIGSREALVKVQEALGWLHLQRGLRTESYASLDKGLALCKDHAEEIGTSLGHASVLCTMGWLMTTENRLPAAGSCLRGAQALLMAVIGAQGIQHLPVLMNIAWLEALQGDTAEANRTLAHALKTYGPLLGRWHPRSAHLIALLGAVAAMDSDWKSAHEYLDMAAKILRSHGLSRTAQGQKITTALEFIAAVR